VQSRNPDLILPALPRANAVNHGIVTVVVGAVISEFLIVGCQHGWLGQIGYMIFGGFDFATIRAAAGY
jgi:hypothetical protein